jgi:GNAT superfamily N-acetyltransferase
LAPELAAAARAPLPVDPAEIAVTLLVLDDETAVATAAVRPSHDRPGTEWEVKRVYVADAHRGRGLSKALMLDLEQRARAAELTTMVLQTGELQPAAHGLYESLGYERVGVYPPYGSFPNERFYRKTL